MSQAGIANIGVIPPPSGSAIVLIETQIASNSPSLSFTTGITPTYINYMFVLSNVLPTSNGQGLEMQVSTDGGSTYQNSNYFSGGQFAAFNTTTFSTFGVFTDIHFSGAVSDSNQYSGTAQLYNVTTGSPVICRSESFYFDTSIGTWVVGNFGGIYTGGGAVDAFQFTFSAGNIASGTFSLYGIKS